MIIELYGEAHELTEPFRIYGTEDEFIRLSEQAKEGARKVSIGWIEVDPSDKTHVVKTKPQNPEIKPWLRMEMVK